MESAAELKREIEAREQDLAALKVRLEALQRACDHKFDPVQYVPVVATGYQIPGDQPGTMGVDWRGPLWVIPPTIPRWARTCPLCALTQTTTRTAVRVRSGSLPGTTADEHLPIFDGLEHF